ncbi:hypothetical protein PybrP1_012880 [[Pythium] brassicae (nom. inval.)]|nr:hypothetical protein PybrP1_012880 [[Pythium] brassicae (nom. inval.)]
MLLSTMRSKARHASSQEKAPVAAAPPPSTKKQRSIHDFFAQDIVRETTRKKREPAAASRLTSEDVAPVTKRIDYDSSSSGMEDEESSEDPSVASQASEPQQPRQHPPHPKPKKIDFSSQRSEPDGEPYEIPGAARSVVSSQQFLDNLSAPPFDRMYSQDEMDFLTPMDQPVLPLSHPTTPSPLKKRQRRNEAGDFVDQIREEEVQNLTQDMTHMDVCHHLNSVPPPPSFSSDSMPSPRHFLPPTPLALAETPARSFLPSKRRSRPDSNEGRSSNDSVTTSSAQMLETVVNPFAPTPASDSKRKRLSRKRQSFPPPWSAALGAVPLSKYLSDFTELELLGSGSFSKVFRCMKKLDGWIYAVKKSKHHFRGKADTERALREVQALAALSSSRHVVRYFDAWVEDDLLYIQLESCTGCSLGGFLDKYKPHHIPEHVLCKLLCHLAQALLDMHSKKMVHMDVKIQNVLVGEGDCYKLGDLGTVAHMDGSMEITEGDNRYLSRELMEGSRTNLRAGDIFALGATIYELALGSTLPSGGEDWQRIRDGDLAMFRQYSNSLQHLIASMMHPDPLQRPMADEILQHEVHERASTRMAALALNPAIKGFSRQSLDMLESVGVEPRFLGKRQLYSKYLITERYLVLGSYNLSPYTRKRFKTLHGKDTCKSDVVLGVQAERRAREDDTTDTEVVADFRQNLRGIQYEEPDYWPKLQELNMRTLATFNHGLPTDIAEMLAALQDRAARLLRASRAHDRERAVPAVAGAVREFDVTLVAAASLAQVLRGVDIQGCTVAVNVQYPSLASQMRAQSRENRIARTHVQQLDHLDAATLRGEHERTRDEDDAFRELETLKALIATGQALVVMDVTCRARVATNNSGEDALQNPWKRRVRLVAASSAREKQRLLDAYELDTQQELRERNLELVGFTELMDVLVTSGKPLVGHNLLLDLMQCFEKLPLPSRCSEFLRELNAWTSGGQSNNTATTGDGGGIYDTKEMVTYAMETLDMFANNLHHSALETVYEALSKTPFHGAEVRVKGPSPPPRPKARVQAHQAGYDAFMTGFVALAALGGSGSDGNAAASVPLHARLLQFRNVLHVSHFLPAHTLRVPGPFPDDAETPSRACFLRLHLVRTAASGSLKNFHIKHVREGTAECEGSANDPMPSVGCVDIYCCAVSPAAAVATAAADESDDEGRVLLLTLSERAADDLELEAEKKQAKRRK